jgi:iron complex outermembrane receptor protein
VHQLGGQRRERDDHAACRRQLRGGISPTHGGGGSDVTTISSGGAGTLSAETSLSRSYGFVFSPNFLPDYLGKFEFSVDWYDIEVENEVTQLGAQAIVGGCYASLNHGTDPLCSLFTRQLTGVANFQNILTVTDNYLNISTQKTRGVDISARYGVELPVGRLTLNVDATKAMQQISQLQPTSKPRDIAGEIGSPNWVGNFDANYEIGKWSFFYSARYIGNSSNRDHFGTRTPTYYGLPVSYVISTKPVFYSNLSVSRELPWNSTVRLGVSNLFDKDPPSVTSGRRSGETQNLGNVPLDGSQYDLIGRTFFVNFTKKF